MVANGSVYIGAADNKLYALDAATGALRWSFETGAWITNSVAYADDAVVVASRDGLVHVIDTKTGLKRFVYDAGYDLRGGAAIKGDLAYLVAHPSAIHAIDRRAITYPFERAFWHWKVQGWQWGFLSGYPQQKGAVWILEVRGLITGSPALAHGAVYAATDRGLVFALDAENGEVLWVKKDLIKKGLADKITTAVTVAGQTVLIGTEEGAVLGLDAASGDLLWEFQLEGGIADNPIVAGDTIYVVTKAGVLYALAGPE